MKLTILGDSLNLVLVEGTAGLYKISGTAIHPCKTFHPADWAKIRYYIEPCLEKAAPTLVGKPIVIDHSTKLSEGNVVTVSYWKDGQLFYEATITKDVYDLFKNGMLKPHVSVGVNWMKPGGGLVVGESGEIIPYGFDFSEFSLLMNMEPGDPQTTLQLWEGVLKEAVAAENQKPKSGVFGGSGGKVSGANQPITQTASYNADKVNPHVSSVPVETEGLRSYMRQRGWR
jgi:hypothetical protein